MPGPWLAATAGAELERETMPDRRIKARALTLSARELLARWIQRGRMSQQEAAEVIGISKVKLNQYLQGAARPSLETAIRIEDAAGIGIRLWLLEPSTNGKIAEPDDSVFQPEISGGDGRINRS